jgi:pimeloyl-ACP methyl ester carboxylesterase
MSAMVTTDHWIVHPHGRIFARRWQPQAARATAAPLVLMHDSLGCVDLWRDFPAQLASATRRSVIAYDRLGFGRSDPRVGRPAPGFIAEEARTAFPCVREQLGIARFAVAGHSVGGGISVEIAAHMAADCEALVTIAAQAFVEDRTLAGLRVAQEQFRDPAQVQRLARYQPGPRAAWALDAWLGTWLDPAFRDWSLDAVLPRVACPVLAIHGELDEYASVAHPRRIVAHVGGPSRMEIVAGAGHFPHREQPQHVAGLIAAFLANPG